MFDKIKEGEQVLLVFKAAAFIPTPNAGTGKLEMLLNVITMTFKSFDRAQVVANLEALSSDGVGVCWRVDPADLLMVGTRGTVADIAVTGALRTGQGD